MLTQTIDRSLVLELGTTLFNNIDGNVNGERLNVDVPDNSFYITERLLLYPRLSKDDCINTFVTVLNSSSAETEIKQDELESTAKEALKNAATLNILTVDVQKKLFKEMINSVNIDGFEKPELINKYLEVKGCAALFVNKEKRRSLIIAPRFTPARFHAVCSILPAIYPWYFEDDRNHLTEDELKLLSSFDSEDIDQFLAAHEKLVNNLDLKKYIVANAFAKFSRKQRQSRINELNREIEHARNAIDNILADISRYETSIRRFTDELFGIENKPVDDGSNEVISFLNASKNVSFTKVNDNGTFTFYCHGFLSNYPDGVAAMIANRNSVLYEGYDGPCTEDRIALIKAIFVDETLCVRMGAYYALNPSQNMIVGQGGFKGPEFRLTNCIPNPHIYHYSCLGGNGSAIASCVAKGDLVGALSQCAASAISLNIRETPTFRYFLVDLLSDEFKCIVAPGKEEPMTATEACAYLAEKKQENNQ